METPLDYQEWVARDRQDEFEDMYISELISAFDFSEVKMLGPNNDSLQA